MAWRKNVNATLRRFTGHELRRSTPTLSPGRSLNGSPQRSPRQSAQQSPQQSPQGADPAAGPKFPADYDDSAKEIIRAVSPYTMTSPERLNALILAVRHVSRHNIAGDIVECGVWRGGSMQAAARTLLSVGDTERHLYLFDTFEGMPEPTEKDLRRDGESAADLLARQDRSRPIWAVATLEDVKEGFQQVPYPADRVHFVPGLVEETIPAEAPERISILRLDTDWYASTRHELEHLYPRLVSGGVLLIDDYGWWQGSRSAVDEFLEKTGARLLLLRMDEGRIAVKP
ncbi:TylF/MycF/NovP-related O-methyltransferase [Streptomyces sp. NBC_00878]|uniref:TylF/MycF/NovP-related O-methyltransferase n=1 Tax=Streptomyces sp. NBC_00878 TaxID=2975854 RepID=UPI00224DB2B9|nr:TylF/MycF/NovP-related O-methyltransferase [Streptomyces sp. NBC_00878]MCX4903593.1 TylF/MycF family methyltransferase [Streptomyces sp. NBC_00878]